MKRVGKVLKTKKERLAYIEECVKRGNKEREAAKKEVEKIFNNTRVCRFIHSVSKSVCQH